jgi:hypothetical protein
VSVDPRAASHLLSKALARLTRHDVTVYAALSY